MAKQNKTLPQLSGQMFVTDGGIETHMIFNEGHDLPHFSVFQLNDSEQGRQAIGPRRDAWQYDGAMSVDEAMRYHGAQVAAFAEAEADLVTAYTLTNTPEAIGIAKLAEAAGLPCVISFTLETGGKPLARSRRQPAGHQLTT